MSDELAIDVAAQGDSDALRLILEEVCRVTDMGFAAIARVTEHRWIACQVLDRIEFGLKPGDELQIKTTICDELRQTGEAIVIDDVRSNPAWRTHHAPILYGFESYASFPVWLEDGTFFGTLCAVDPAPHLLSATAIVTALEDYAKRVAQILSRSMSIA